MEKTKKVSNSHYNHWLTEELKTEVRKVYEPKYKRKLQDSEVEEIAENLAGFMESFLKFKLRQKNESINKKQESPI